MLHLLYEVFTLLILSIYGQWSYVKILKINKVITQKCNSIQGILVKIITTLTSFGQQKLSINNVSNKTSNLLMSSIVRVWIYKVGR